MASAIEVLEAKIEKQDRELAKGKALLADLQAREKVLDEEKAHRDEDFDQLNERVDVMKDQIEKRDDRLESLRQDYTVLYNTRHGIEGAEEEEQMRKIQQAKSITPKEGLSIVEKYFTAIKRRLGGVTGDGESGKRRLGQVTVFYAGRSEAATFRLTPTYTFAQLTRDACRFWGLNPQHGTLRDQFNSLWPTEAMVGEELGEATTVPYIKLVDNAPGKVVHSIADAKQAEKGKKRKNRGGAAQYDSDSDSVDNDRSEDEQEPDEYREYRLAVQRTKDLMAKRLSPFFHGPEHSRAALKFRGFEHEGENHATKERESLFGDCAGLIFFAFFLAAFLVPLSIRLGILENNDMFQSVTTSFLKQPFSAADAPDGTATWNDMSTLDQFYDFTEQTLLSTLFQQVTYSGRELPVGDQGIVRGANQLVGGIRLRQYRTKDNSCTVVPRFAVLQAHGCFRPYSFDRQSLAAYGPGADVEGFTWSKAFSLNTYTVVTDDAYYDRSGYAAELPNEGGKARLVLANLKANSWLDRNSRSVFLTFNLLNVNYNKYALVQLIAEFDPAGGVDTSSSIDVISLTMYDFGRSGTFMLLVLCDAFALLYVLFAVYQDTTEGLLYGMSAFFGTLWNVVDVLNAICMIALTALRILYDTVMVVQLDPQVPHYVQVSHVMDMYNSIITLYSFVAFLSLFSVLKYLRANAALSRVYQSLAVASGVLGAYFFIFIITIAAFVLSGYFVFGAELRAFRTVLSAAQEVLFMLTGNADYPGMRWADPIFAPIFFILFAFIVFFVMVNFFLSIVNDSYNVVATSISFSREPFWSRLLTAPLKFVNKSSTRGGGEDGKKKGKKGKKKSTMKRRKK